MCYVKKNKNLFLVLIKRNRANRAQVLLQSFRRKTENGIANMQQQFVYIVTILTKRSPFKIKKEKQKRTKQNKTKRYKTINTILRKQKDGATQCIVGKCTKLK